MLIYNTNAIQYKVKNLKTTSVNKEKKQQIQI